MSDIPAFPYVDLWVERQILSVANLTRQDGTSFFDVAEVAGIETVTESFALDDANIALERLRSGALRGAAVLVMACVPRSPDLMPVDHGQRAVE